MALAEKQQTLIDDYSIIEDPMERFAAIVALGRKNHDFPDDQRLEENLVQGCTSQVWLIGKTDAENCVHFQIDADAPGIKGVAVLMCGMYSGEKADEIIATEPDVIEALKIDRNLTPTRLNGLRHIRQRIVEIASES